ncbi:MAG: undecaprenyl-phosphate glucose phosphotransferase [Clostridia bacterium]|nr:undecaprenyl-phosphate glucose phosphotransferase [Clostridia bacterium]
MNSSRNRNLFATLENGLDIFLNLASIVMAYMFAILFHDPGTMVLESPRTMFAIFVVIMLQSFVFMIFNMYSNQPYVRAMQSGWRIVRVNIFYYLLVECAAILIYSEERQEFAFIWVIVSAIISTAVLTFKRRMARRLSAFFGKRNYNLRKVILVGDNTATVQDFVKQVSKNPQYGMMIIGYVGDKIHHGVGCDKLGGFKDLAKILDEKRPTDVVFAIDAYDKRHLIKLVNLCDDRCIKVYFLPVIYGFFKNARQIEPVGSIPVINIHSTPLDDKFNAAVKRAVDIIGSLVLIILTSPVMLAAAIGVYLSSPGPVLFKQERVGKLGKTFTMLKFRSMKVNVDSQTAWTTDEDGRKTRFGNFIRKTSIDELPQLFNVLVGDMSLVGPRPEVPHFVEYFRDIIPLYMVKHYVKPGMTGLAQVKGLRGDTSVEDRIHEDIEYIENWSLGMDIGILLKTPFKAINKSEKYAEEKKEEEEMTESANTDIVAEKLAADIAPEQEQSDAPKEAKGKILYAASTMSHINNFHLKYIENLRRDGYEVKIMARGEGADFNIPFEKKMFSSSNTACRAEIRKILAKESFDTLVLNTSLAAFHIRFALPKKDRPRVVNIVHGYLFSKNTKLIKSLLLLAVEKLVAKKTDNIIVMNEDDRIIATKHKLALGKIYVSRGMGASVREPMTRPEALRRETLCQDKFVMAFVGELSARKNQKFLISALNDVKEKIPDAHLWLVGDGPAEDSLRRLAREVDVSESVHFLGNREDACDIMRACDLYVSASMIEGMPFNIIEALGCKKTILASRVKGHTDLIEDGKSGFLFGYNKKREFVDKVVRIYNGELSADADAAYERYLAFDNEKVFGDTYKLIKESIECELD